MQKKDVVTQKSQLKRKEGKLTDGENRREVRDNNEGSSKITERQNSKKGKT